MRTGIGLPAAVPGAEGTVIAEWARAAETHGFASLGVLDRLVYDSLDPIVALAAAASCTDRVELMTAVLTVPYRQNAVVLGKQLASLDRMSRGRLTAGLALGGWPADYVVSGASQQTRGADFERMLATMRRVWAGEVAADPGRIPALPRHRPGVLLGGLAPVSYARVAHSADGWVAPFFGYDVLTAGIASVRSAWTAAGRSGSPRVVVARYFSLGRDADTVADGYLRHYYGDEYFPAARADTLTSARRVLEEVGRLAEAGCDDLLLFPCSPDPGQVGLLSEVLAGADVVALGA
jgi:alkanesulfonate monooxygenase SsuD/methylene tetrahydromethanopterin reductase-like flavin-dependent oxidoreductase (luciferase family)